MNRRMFLKGLCFAGCSVAIAGCISRMNILSRGGIIPEENYEFSIKNFKNKNLIPALDIHLVEHCNLSCKYCAHFSNIAEPENLDINEFEKDLIRLKEITNGRIEGFKLLGGEPLLHPQVCDFFDLVRKYFPDPECTYIWLLTNGILLNSMKDSFWESMHNNSVILKPSLYPVKIDTDKWLEKSKKYGVRIIPDTKEELQENIVKNFMKFNIDLDGKIDSVNSWKNCDVKVMCALGLQNGKIYQCAFAAYIRHFNKKFGTSLVLSENDYLDIYKAKSMEDIFNFFEKPFPFCKYCGPVCESRKWEVSKEHDITEWLRDS